MGHIIVHVSVSHVISVGLLRNSTYGNIWSEGASDRSCFQIVLLHKKYGYTLNRNYRGWLRYQIWF